MQPSLSSYRQGKPPHPHQALQCGAFFMERPMVSVKQENRWRKHLHDEAIAGLH